jgi:hypothetical protein
VVLRVEVDKKEGWRWIRGEQKLLSGRGVRVARGVKLATLEKLEKLPAINNYFSVFLFQKERKK